METGIESVDKGIEMIAKRMSDNDEKLEDYENNKVVGIFNDGRIEIFLKEEGGEASIGINILAGEQMIFNHDLNLIEEEG